MRRSLLAIVFIINTQLLMAQMPNMNRGGGQMNMGHIYGKVLDSASNKPLEAVSIQLLQNKLDSVTKKRKDVVVAGMLTNHKGEFSLENLSVIATYKLKVSAIGYKVIEEKVFFAVKMGGGDYSQMLNAVDKDLGNFKLQPDIKQLKEVTITSDKPLLQMAIDRKIFNVEKNLTSVGGTAIDVMKNIPSVSVDIDGNVTLRNASPQIFIDGRPTTLTLDQIPADAIATVEIITNPSAKYDASGGGAGILNIVLKKARKTGYNGNVRANIDSRGRFGGGGDINVRQGKVNIFANAMYNQRKSLSTVNTTRTDFLQNDTTLFQSQQDKPVNHGYFAFFRTGLDYFIDNRNTITLGGAFVRGKFNSTDDIDILKQTNAPSYSSILNGNRNGEGHFSFKNYGGTLSYKHNFAKSGKEWTADVNYNHSNNENTSLYNTQYFNSNGSPNTPVITDQGNGSGEQIFTTFQTDFVNPITENIKIEMGARGAIRDFVNNTVNKSTVYTYTNILQTDYKFKDQVYAAYATFSQKIKKFSYQIGLRVESSLYDGTVINKGETFSNKFPFSFFPSVFLTQKINDQQDIQLNYSRKVNRPNFFQLLPFIDFSDSLNLSKGNPNLIPEFTNLVELSYQVDLKKGNNILASVYFKGTDGLITRYQYKDKNPISGKTDSVVITSYANANSSYAYGLEVTSKNKIASWWEVTTNLNLYNSQINGSNIQAGLTSQQVSWFGKMNFTFKIPKNYSIQLNGDYQSKTLLPQSGRGGGGGGGGMMFGGGQLSTANGYIKPNYGVDIAFKKEFLKNNAASLTLSINDIFRTKLYRSHSESVFFVQDNERQRDPQVARLSFNWRFGKLDVSLFKKKNIKGEIEGMQNGMQGVGQ
jgi:outer membrane receptor protein involved in Fe transport